MCVLFELSAIYFLPTDVTSVLPESIGEGECFRGWKSLITVVASITFAEILGVCGWGHTPLFEITRETRGQGS